jgi:hypothetical protein
MLAKKRKEKKRRTIKSYGSAATPITDHEKKMVKERKKMYAWQ